MSMLNNYAGDLEQIVLHERVKRQQVYFSILDDTKVRTYHF